MPIRGEFRVSLIISLSTRECVGGKSSSRSSDSLSRSYLARGIVRGLIKPARRIYSWHSAQLPRMRAHRRVYKNYMAIRKRAAVCNIRIKSRDKESIYSKGRKEVMTVGGYFMKLIRACVCIFINF